MIRPLLSIIITNYNYGRFLQDAINSAIAQTYSNVEIIVVDDGSTDHSRDVIAAATCHHIVPVLKGNGGQASAFNAGFARCRGDIVLFLDADDMLLPTIGERVVAALAVQPDAAKVHYHLEVVDAAGAPTGKLMPSQPLLSGDLRRHVLEHYVHNSSPTSGNAFPRRVLRRLLPMPEEPYRISADHYLVHMAVLLGPVITLPEPGARYRQHDANNVLSAAKEGLSERFVIRVRNGILRKRETRARQLGLAQELGLRLPSPQHNNWRVDARHRLVSLKLDPTHHPIPGDTLWRVAWCGATTSMARTYNPGAWWPERLLQAGWFVAVAALPRSAARSLIEQYYFPRVRGRLARFILDRFYQWFRCPAVVYRRASHLEHPTAARPRDL